MRGSSSSRPRSHGTRNGRSCNTWLSREHPSEYGGNMMRGPDWNEPNSNISVLGDTCGLGGGVECLVVEGRPYYNHDMMQSCPCTFP